MTKYLLTCGCGNAVAVDIGQAGERVTCHCGATLEVPPLRELRQLPVTQESPSRTESNWSARKGVATAFLIPAIALALWALWSRVTEPRIAPFDPAVRREVVDEGLKTMTPVETWNLWIDRYRPMAEHGFTALEHPNTAAVNEEVAKRRFQQKILLSVVGVCCAVALIAGLWPRSRVAEKERQGDKETRRTG